MFLETILQQLTQTLSLVPVTNKENAWMNQSRMKTMTMMMNDLGESAESGDSEMEENKDRPELFDEVILRSGRLATT